MRRQANDSIATGVFFIADTMMYFFVAVIDIFFPNFCGNDIDRSVDQVFTLPSTVGDMILQTRKPGLS